MGNLLTKPEEVPLEQLKHLGWEQGRRREVIRKVNEQSSFPTPWERQANEERDAQKRSNRVKIFTSKAHKYYPGENNTAFDANTGTYCLSENNMEPTFNARKYEPPKDNTCEPGSPTRPELAQKEFCTAVTFFRLTTWNFFCTKIEDTDGKFFADQENGRPEPARDTVKNQKLTGFSILSFRNYIGAFGSQILATFKDTVKDIGKAAGRYILDKAKQVQDWIKKNPRTAAAIIIPLVTLALTPLLLHILGFTAGGIAAGSAAAAIQAIIGNVAAGSLFATCTSAMMGGFGALIIFGGPGLFQVLEYWYISRRKKSCVSLVLPST